MIPHAWDLSPKDAIALQKSLAGQVDTNTPINIDVLRHIGGVDVSVKGGVSRAAVVVLSFPALHLIEIATAQIETPFPYISGLLTFREGAVILAAHAKLTQRPDAYIFDGMGVMHPRRLGVASHIGLWLNAPTVGCGKTHLLGEYDDPAPQKGSYAPVMHNDEQVGYVLRTRDKVKPVYISAGHRATHQSARELALRCTTRYRLPEPIRAAHKAAGDF